MDKEAILDKYAVGVAAGQYTIECGKANQAMDEYAKQQAIGFAEWIYYSSADEQNGIHTTEELYSLYLASINTNKV